MRLPLAWNPAAVLVSDVGKPPPGSNETVLARISPQQKTDLISLHQENGAIVAMIGDGVLDAPALEQADIGIVSGQKGAQAAREAADLIVADDDPLGTVVMAVANGRTIFGNIRKFLLFLLSGNASEILTVTVAWLAGAPLPITPSQILYLNTVGDIFPALGQGVGKGSPHAMKRPPRDPREPSWAGCNG